VVVGVVEKPDKPIDFVPRFLSEAPDRLKCFFRVTGVL
jgi:hypothetical protein